MNSHGSIQSLEKEAVRSARSQDWPEAVRINLSIVKLQPKNVSALLRLAWAYAKQGKSGLAKRMYKKVLRIDKYNLIANKNLKRLDSFKQKTTGFQAQSERVSSLFLEESGKTKVVSLVRLAPPKVLGGLECAQPVELVPRKKCISVRDENSQYLGIIPDDLSFRLLKFIRGGNEYKAWIKKIEKQGLQIFIRETKQAEKFKGLASFSSQGIDYEPSLSPENIHKGRPKVVPTGEEGEARKHQ